MSSGIPSESASNQPTSDKHRRSAADSSDWTDGQAGPHAPELRPIVDSPEQSAIINAGVDDDLLVVAGAGSGKTYTMTRRIVNLIGQGVAPERILGLTFTRKAASELLSRVSAAVTANRSVVSPQGGSSHSARQEDAFLKPTIATYDAFFQSLVRQYGLLVGFDQQTQPLSDAGAFQLASNVIGEHMDLVFEQDLGAFSTVVSDVLDLSQNISNSMIGGDCMDVDRAIGRIRDWDRTFVNQLDHVMGSEIAPEESRKPRFPKRRKKDSDKDHQQRVDQYWNDWHQHCLFFCARLRQTVGRREILLDLVAQYQEAKRRMNMAEFSDFNIAAYQLVTRFPSIAQRLRHRFKHVLLDEYQDTSTTQTSLLAALFHAEGGAGQSVAVNAVGDPFQSIYAWRGASPGAFRIFQQVFEQGTDHRPYPLSVTRRNARLILQAANNLTAPLRVPQLPPSSAQLDEVRVSPLEAMDQASQGTIGLLGYQTLGQEIDAVARFAKEIIREHSHKNFSSEGTDSRRAAEDSNHSSGPQVAVLFRSKSSMPQFAEGLENMGLTTMMVGYSALLQSPEVLDLLALLHILADHTDSVSLMRLLATPRFDLNAKDLQGLSQLAERQNVAYQFRSLVQAGLASADSPRGQWKALVRDLGDHMPNAVFLVDLLCQPDFSGLLESSKAISDQGKGSVRKMVRVLRQVQASLNRPLDQVVHAAVESLNLDIDLVVAQAVSHSDRPLATGTARASLDDFSTLVDTYMQEIAEGQRVTLSGFVSWVDSLNHVPDQPAGQPDMPVDVVLMSIHQAKGLEWDAVAVVGIAEKTFPSNQGDHLVVTADEQHPGAVEPDRWVPPQYHSTAKTWLTNPSTVPVPVRVDSAILPKFPHDASYGADVQGNLRGLDSVESFEDEILGESRVVRESEKADQNGQKGTYLTQTEEFGNRYLADERRLAYVALTRARTSVLLTYSASSSLDLPAGQTTEQTSGSEEQSSEKAGGATTGPSNFWMEVHDSLSHNEGLVPAGAPEQEGTDNHESHAGYPTGYIAFPKQDLYNHDGSVDSPESLGLTRPEGYFLGEQAADLKRAVVDEAWRANIGSNDGPQSLPWPCPQSDEVSEAIDQGARAVEQTLETMHEEGDAHPQPLHGNSLASRAQMLIDDHDLMPFSVQSTSGVLYDLNASVVERGRKFLARTRQNVTAIQVLAGHLSDSQAQGYWRGIVRPIPHIATPSAQAGTLFHTWAERFISAYGQGEIGDDLLPDVDGSLSISDTGGNETRSSLLADLERQETKAALGLSSHGQYSRAHKGPEDTESPVDRRLLVWKRALVDSRWTRRLPMAVERQIVASIPELDNIIVNGKLDAVFYGGLDKRDSGKQFTIIDWKTGNRPRTAEDLNKKLLQLDLYRLLLSAMAGVPLDTIDASLYYVSEPDERAREMPARAKDKQEILKDLAVGIPPASDND